MSITVGPVLGYWVALRIKPNRTYEVITPPDKEKTTLITAARDIALQNNEVFIDDAYFYLKPSIISIWQTSKKNWVPVEIQASPSARHSYKKIFPITLAKELAECFAKIEAKKQDKHFIPCIGEALSQTPIPPIESTT